MLEIKVLTFLTGFLLGIKWIDFPASGYIMGNAEVMGGGGAAGEEKEKCWRREKRENEGGENCFNKGVNHLKNICVYVIYSLFTNTTRAK